MAKMGNKLVALCSLALGAIYTTGYVVTESPASVSAMAQPGGAPQTTSQSGTSNVTSNSTQQGAGAAGKNTSQTSNNQQANQTTSSQSSQSGAAKTSHGAGSKSSSSTGQTSSGKSTSQSSTKSSTASQTSTQKTSKSASSSTSKPAAVQHKWLDGTYQGSGSDRIGTVYVAVTIQGGKIANVKITQCDTHYPQQYIDPVLPQEVLQSQSANVNAVSGATDMSYDFAVGVQQALSKAQNPNYHGN